MSGKLPFMKFFPADWLNDTMCMPLELQGFWMRILCHMHRSVRRGYLLQANGQPFSLEETALATGSSTEMAAHLRQCLLTSGVASETPEGALFCRRMVREADKRLRLSEAGKKGAKARYSGPGHGVGNGVPHSHSLTSDFCETETGSNVKSAPSCAEPAPQGKSSPGVGGLGGEGPSEAILLAQEFSFVSTKCRGSGFPYYCTDGSGCEKEMAELLRHVSADKIRAEIHREDRDRSEWFGDMARRLLRDNANGTWKGGRHGHNGRQFRFDPARDRRDP